MGLEFRVINSFKLPFPFFPSSQVPPSLPPSLHDMPMPPTHLLLTQLHLDPQRELARNLAKKGISQMTSHLLQQRVRGKIEFGNAFHPPSTCGKYNQSG